MHEFVDTAGAHPDLASQPVLAHSERLMDFVEEDIPKRLWWQPLVILRGLKGSQRFRRLGTSMLS